MHHELSPARGIGANDGCHYAELVGCTGHANDDAFHLRGMEGTSFQPRDAVAASGSRGQRHGQENDVFQARPMPGSCVGYPDATASSVPQEAALTTVAVERLA